MAKINRKNDRIKETIAFPSKSYEDVITYEKIHRHLRDITDEITEADIENVRTDMHSFVANNAGPQERAVLIEMSKHLDAEKDIQQSFEEGKKINSSWNIISE